MKALARHPGAAQTLAESDRLQLMFHMVVMGGTMPPLSKSQSFKRESDSAPPLHLAQLYRHVLQVSAALQLKIVSVKSDNKQLELICDSCEWHKNNGHKGVT